MRLHYDAEDKMYVTGWHGLKLGFWENGSLIGRLPPHTLLRAT